MHHVKDLGVIFDIKLSFEAHIKNITKRAFALLGFIMRSLNKFIKPKTYEILYFTYIRSILEDCSPVWIPYYNVHINTIERVQRRYTRYIYKKFYYPGEMNFQMRYARLELMSLENKRIISGEVTL